jgi:methylenetetrahydrofolate dehydrogenase (NADP+) / methenyltetrahydrofolate cyclohydrolase
MVGRIWDGGNVAQEWLERVRGEVVTLQRAGRSPPALAEIRVSASPLDERLQVLQKTACQFTGVSYQVRSFPPTSDHHAILQALAELNAAPNITGIAIHAPSFAHRLELAGAVAPEKDVDGLHPLNLGRLVTNKRRRRAMRGADIVQLLRRASIALAGAHVVCIGNTSGLAGVLALLCLHENATISAWRGTTRWPVKVLRRGDVLVLDTEDVPALDGNTLKPGVVVIDARTQPTGRPQPLREAGFEAVSLLIPVPGGVGPTTVAMRLSSLVARDHTPDKDQCWC